MDPKDLVIFLEPTVHSDARLAYALHLAKRWQAHLIGAFVVPALEIDPHNGFAVGAGITNMLDHYNQAVSEAIAKARAHFDGLTERRSFSAEWRVCREREGETLMLHARHAALAITGPAHAPLLAAPSRLGYATDLIFASGRPTLCLPNGWDPERQPKRIVVGWNASREATRALAAAMPFLRVAESVHLVVVPDSRVACPHGPDPGTDIAAHLARYGIRVVLEQCPGLEAGPVLLQRAAALDADMLVMGAVGRSRISEFIFGGATRHILAKAPLPILLSQ